MTASATDESPHQSQRGGQADRPYQSLYRRYRPQRFEEVRGQDHVTRPLRNAVRDDRVAHAYLFSGPRGTGKTSTARILAKALNCAAPADGEPCGVCESCTSIVGGTSFDVHELDAASNNGVDAMRDLVARAALATPGRWKIYIVDEVHMLSTAASNALLKTLEEPPEHVVFVLATTDPQKVLPTIRSRTQHFEFHLLGEDVLEALLEDVAADAGLDLPEGGLGVALRRGRGSARDALSMLDQVAAAGTAEDDSDALAGIVGGLAERDTAAVLSTLDGALRSGRDPQQVAVDLVERLRAGFLALVAPGVASSPVHSAPVGEEARALGTPRCVRAMELVGGAIVAMRDAPEPRITLEVALVRAAHPEADDTVESLLDRLVQLERRLEHLEAAPPPPHAPSAMPAGGGLPGAGPAPRTARASDPAPGASPAPSDPVPPVGAAVPPGSRPVLGAYRSRPAAGPLERPAAGPLERPAAVPEPPAAVPEPPAAVPEPPAGAPPETSPAGPPAPQPAATVPQPAAPDRDALVAAWGDHVVTALRPKVRAYYQAGRFVGVEGTDAVFALPNAVHVAQAEPLRSEVVAALSAHFGRPIGLRLVAEGTWPPEHPTARHPADAQGATGGADEEPGAAPGAPGPEGAEGAGGESRPEPGDVDDMAPLGEPFDLAPASADTGLTWAEDRLLQAFPGAEEV